MWELNQKGKMNNNSYYNKLKNKKLTDFEEEESPEEE